MAKMRGKHMGWFVIAVAVLIGYFVFKKSKMIGGVTATPSTPYGPGSSGLYSQVG